MCPAFGKKDSKIIRMTSNCLHGELPILHLAKDN